MVKNITQALIAKLPRGTYDVCDTKQSRLVLRVRESGEHSYLVRIRKGSCRRWFTLGRSALLTPTQAREMAHEILADIARGKDPERERREKSATTFGAFLEKQYRPWALAHLKSGESFVGRIERQFGSLFGKKAISEISAFAVERWRAGRIRGPNAVSPATANRDLVALKACLSKAVLWKAAKEHPLRDVKRSKEDRGASVRFLDKAEEERLRAALVDREAIRRAARESANAWRQERGYEPLPPYGAYTDHLMPIVLLALNTGLRRGELFGLQWSDVDLVSRNLTVRGEGAKSGRTRHIPLNPEAHDVLTKWGAKAGLVFPSPDAVPLKSLRTSWFALTEAAKVKDFRFHDLRHTFASKLVQRGVDLNTVRELLGHSDFSLTLRYAHLAAENKAAAVAKLA